MGQQRSLLWPAGLSSGVAPDPCSNLHLVLGAIGPCLTSSKSLSLSGARPACVDVDSASRPHSYETFVGVLTLPYSALWSKDISLILQMTKLRFRATEGLTASRGKAEMGVWS